MKVNIYLRSKTDLFEAEGLYDDGMVIVKKGSRIHTIQASHVSDGQTTVKTVRENKSLVDANGVVLKDYSFLSPSAAANFVTGRSANGYVAWRVDDKNNLGRFLGRERKGSKQAY